MSTKEMRRRRKKEERRRRRRKKKKKKKMADNTQQQQQQHQNSDDLESRFDSAVKYTSTTKTLKPTQEEQLQLYAHFKQATNGPCNIPKPSFWELVAKTKW